jgi:hypothetical protein
LGVNNRVGSAGAGAETIGIVKVNVQIRIKVSVRVRIKIDAEVGIEIGAKVRMANVKEIKRTSLIRRTGLITKVFGGFEVRVKSFSKY